MRNQYFQLEFNETDAYIHIFPPVDGGAQLKIAEVIEYLGTKKYDKYDLKLLNDAVNNLERDSTVSVGDWDMLPCRESMNIDISLDKMKATCRFYPPATGGACMDVKEIIDDLTFRKVRFGVDQEAIAAFLRDR